MLDTSMIYLSFKEILVNETEKEYYNISIYIYNYIKFVSYKSSISSIALVVMLLLALLCHLVWLATAVVRDCTLRGKFMVESLIYQSNYQRNVFQPAAARSLSVNRQD